MFFRQKEIHLASSEGAWFPSWPLFSSLLLHGLMAYFLMTWTFSHVPESASRVVMVQIVEKKQEKAPVPPTPVRPKQKKIQEIVHPKPEPRPVAAQKEEALPTPPILQTAEQKIPQVLPVSEEKIGVEEKPKEERMEKVEPGRWGAPEGPKEAALPSPAQDEPPLSLTEDSGSAKKGIPGGLASEEIHGGEAPGVRPGFRGAQRAEKERSRQREQKQKESIFRVREKEGETWVPTWGMPA